MDAFFGDKPGGRRREINLGGTPGATSSYSDIINQARIRRAQRQNTKQLNDATLYIQKWWTSKCQIRSVKQQLRAIFMADVTSLNALRCLVLIGQDEEVLGLWSSSVLSTGKAILQQSDASWTYLLERTAVRLLQSVADNPQSQYAVSHLRVLESLLSRPDICPYLVKHQLYPYVSNAISRIPVASKDAPSLPLLISVLTAPVALARLIPDCLHELLIHILSIPLLPNRLPLPTVSLLSSRLPLSSLQSELVPDIIEATSTVDKIHLLANLSMFAPPRYSKLPPAALDAYLLLCASLMNSLPVLALEPPASVDFRMSDAWIDAESDDDETTHVAIVSSFDAAKVVLPELDSRTRTRVQTLPSPAHINSLLAATQSFSSRKNLFAFCFALCVVWPTRKEKVLSSITVYNKGGLVRELFRGFVRTSPLGRDDNPGAVMDPANASEWSPLLLLADLYTQALLTMGDDEFFSSGTNPSAPRNPLSLDDLTLFSRKLLNTAFTLYWRDDQTHVKETTVPGVANSTWETVREKVTKCLQAIHARDSRKPFTSPGHWLVTAQMNLPSFVEAVVLEEQQLQPEGGRPLSKRQVALISPRLGVLNNIPFAIPFETRVSIFRHFIVNDMTQHSRGNIVDPWGRRPMARITVRRGMIAQDGFDHLQEADLKAPIAITFIDQFGQEEAGIDGGGVFKEFLTSLCKETFDTDRGLWLSTHQNELYPNPHSYATENHSLSWYRFIGRILGKALYEGILVDIVFAGFFLAKWLGRQSFLDDLASLDLDLYNGLIFLKHYTGNPEDLSLNFTVAVEEFGVAKTIDLIPNGSNIAVTRENRLQYIYLVSHYRLSKQIKRQSEAFFEGLSEMIDPKWLRMFNQQELQILLGGVNSPVDIDDLRANTAYGGLYDHHHQTIELFWKVVNSLDHEQRRALLRFVTSCSRPPLLGFKELVPHFAIRDAGSDESRLPTSSTCVNLLKLPRYTTEHVLREKLVQAINSNAGFDLS